MNFGNLFYFDLVCNAQCAVRGAYQTSTRRSTSEKYVLVTMLVNAQLERLIRSASVLRGGKLHRKQKHAPQTQKKRLSQRRQL